MVLGASPRKAPVWPWTTAFALSPTLRGRGTSLACSLGGIVSSSKEALHLRGDRSLSIVSAKATCKEPGRRQAATAESALWVTSVGPTGGLISAHIMPPRGGVST